MSFRSLALIALTLSVAVSGCRFRSTTDLVYVDVGSSDDRSGSGIEPYFAVVKFQTTVGKPGSTSTEFIDDRLTLNNGNLGPNSPIEYVPTDHPAQSTSTTFDKTAGNAEAATTNGLTISGRIIVGLEEDNRGWDPCCGITGVRDTLRDITNDLATELVVLEQIQWSPFVLPLLVSQVETFVDGAIRQLPGQNRSDDLIDIHIVLNVHASQNYYDELRTEWAGSNVPACDGTAALLPSIPGEANYILSVCPGGSHTIDLRFDAGHPTPTYILRIQHSLTSIQ